MRVLFVTPYFYPAEAFGGPVKVAFDFGRELVKRGNEVVVFTSDAKDLKSRLNTESAEVDGMNVHYFRNLSMFFVKGSKLFVTPELSKKIKSDLKSFDIIHLHEYTTYQNIIVHKFATKYSVPYILQAHGSLLRIGSRKTRKRLYDLFFGRKLLKDASNLIALTPIEAKQYVEAGAPEEKIVVIPNGLDLSEYVDLPPKGSFRKKFGMNETEKIVLYLGRIHKTKGLDLLAVAFSIVSKNLERARLVVIGPDDGYKITFSRLISDLKINEKVLFTGFVDKKDKISALIDSDVFVTPRFDGFPVTFLEACVTKCPIVTATDELNWVHNNVGYVTEYSTTKLAKAILNILQDEDVQRKFKNNCRNTMKNFEISTVVSKLEKTYRSVLK